MLNLDKDKSFVTFLAQLYEAPRPKLWLSSTIFFDLASDNILREL